VGALLLNPYTFPEGFFFIQPTYPFAIPLSGVGKREKGSSQIIRKA
jgi:hypothetical protein